MKANTTQLKTAQSLVLCHFNTTAPATNVLNRSATARVTASAAADKHAARVYNTTLQAKGTAVGRAISLQQKTGVSIRRYGLPCPMGGIYLRVKDVPEVQNVFDDALVDLDAIREDILRTYPIMMDALRVKLGQFIREIEIPSATQVAARFTMDLRIINAPAPINDGVLSGLTDEVANRVRADSQRQINEMLKASHAGPVEDLKVQLAEFIDRLRNAERLHFTQFEKLRDEVRRVKNLNVLGLPEIDEVLRMTASVAATPTSELTKDERVKIARRAELASAKADETLANLGL